jgi:hypothetical protein
MLPYPEQKRFVVEAQYCVLPDDGDRFFRRIDALTRQGALLFRVRNQVRRELKARGCHLPRRGR